MRKEDCEAIAKLLDSGFSIKDALVVLKEKENEKAFDEIMNRLNDGESFFICTVQKAMLSYLKA